MAAMLLASLTNLTVRLLSASSSAFSFFRADSSATAVEAEQSSVTSALSWPTPRSGRLARNPSCSGSSNLRQVAFDADDILSDFDYADDIKLGGLPTEHSWELFCRCAFGDGGRDPPPELAVTGRAIVDKCRGVPLVVAVVAGMLYSETRMDYWDEVLNNVVWDFEEAEESVLRVLTTSSS